MDQGSEVSGIIEEIRASFEVDLAGGLLFWRANKQRPDLVGAAAGFVDNHGYVRVTFKGRRYLRSHLLFALFYGRWPVGQVDHINRNRADDRPSNLREVTHHQNMWNRTPKARGLPMGVTAKGGRFTARIMCRRQLHRLRMFATADEAASAYQEKRKELYGEYA